MKYIFWALGFSLLFLGYSSANTAKFKSIELSSIQTQWFFYIDSSGGGSFHIGSNLTTGGRLPTNTFDVAELEKSILDRIVISPSREFIREKFGYVVSIKRGGLSDLDGYIIDIDFLNQFFNKLQKITKVIFLIFMKIRLKIVQNCYMIRNTCKELSLLSKNISNVLKN